MERKSRCKIPVDVRILFTVYARMADVFMQISKQLLRNEHLSNQLTTLVRFQLFLALVTLLCIATIISIYYLGDKLVVRRRLHSGQ